MSRAGMCWLRPTASSASTAGTVRPSRRSVLLGREARGSFTAVYSARVRITVRTPDGTVVRDGHGTGEAFGGSAGEVHNRALKAAETDATKQALATLGNAFGLALYVGHISVPNAAAPPKRPNGAKSLPGAKRRRRPAHQRRSTAGSGHLNTPHPRRNSR